MQSEVLANPTRRTFVLKGGAAVIAGRALLGTAVSLPAFFLGGCNIIQDIQNWIPIALASLASITALLGPLVSPAIALIIAPIKTGFADLLAATQAYADDTNPADKATTLAKIQTYLNDLVSNFQVLLNSLPGGAIVSLAIGLVQIILSTIAGFLGQLPPSASLKMAKTLTVKGQTVAITPVVRTRRRYKHDWNTAVTDAGHPELKMHISFAEHF